MSLKKHWDVLIGMERDMDKRCDVISMGVAITCLDDAVGRTECLVSKPLGSYICVSNVHMCMEVFDSQEFEKIVNGADLVIPDGRPIYWAQKLLGFSQAEQVRGQDIMNALCASSGEKGLKIGFYGGSSNELLDQVIQKLNQNYSDINVSYSFSPPFRMLTDEEDIDVIESINSSKVDILFVGIGCPKQERWMAEHKDQLNCVMLGVGAAFDFIAGSKKHAPIWMQVVGLEWFYRLIDEPKRLWRRYLKQNPRFIYYFLQQWLLGKKFN